MNMNKIYESIEDVIHQIKYDNEIIDYFFLPNDSLETASQLYDKPIKYGIYCDFLKKIYKGNFIIFFKSKETNIVSFGLYKKYSYGNIKNHIKLVIEKELLLDRYVRIENKTFNTCIYFYHIDLYKYSNEIYIYQPDINNKILVKEYDDFTRHMYKYFDEINPYVWWDHPLYPNFYKDKLDEDGDIIIEDEINENLINEYIFIDYNGSIDNTDDNTDSDTDDDIEEVVPAPIKKQAIN